MDLTGPDNASIKAMRDALLDPARRDQTVSVEGDEAEVRFDPEPGVDVRVQFPQAPEGMALTTYKAVDERPTSYPPELPFLPGVQASVTGRDGDASVQWWSVPEVEGALAQLRAQCAADGWVEGAETGIEFLPGFRILNFERADGMARVIHVVSTGNGTMIQLL